MHVLLKMTVKFNTQNPPMDLSWTPVLILQQSDMKSNLRNSITQT